MKKCSVGGQAVLEGVMMKGPKRIAIAVRKADGTIELHREEAPSITEKYKILKLPVLRGIVMFVETMVLGIRTLTTSAEMYGGDLEDADDYKPSKVEKYLAEKTGKKPEDIMILVAVVLAIGFAILLFVILPSFLTNLVKGFVKNSILMNLIEGFIRLGIFLLYITAITRLKDIARVFRYHGAEHKTVHCYEHEKELTVENVRSFSTLHPRCGTNFLFLVILISIFVFSFLGWDRSWWMRIVSRMLLLPIVAGISYEVVRWAGRSESLWVTIVSWPGLMLQKLTTAEPDDSMIEVAIMAFNSALYEEEVSVDGQNHVTTESYVSSGTFEEGGSDGLGDGSRVVAQPCDETTQT